MLCFCWQLGNQRCPSLTRHALTSLSWLIESWRFVCGYCFHFRRNLPASGFWFSLCVCVCNNFKWNLVLLRRVAIMGTTLRSQLAFCGVPILPFTGTCRWQPLWESWSGLAVGMEKCLTLPWPTWQGSKSSVSESPHGTFWAERTDPKGAPAAPSFWFPAWFAAHLAVDRLPLLNTMRAGRFSKMLSGLTECILWKKKKTMHGLILFLCHNKLLEFCFPQLLEAPLQIA